MTRMGGPDRDGVLAVQADASVMVRRSIRHRVVRLVRSMGPVSLLFGPVFQREMRTIGRKRSTYLIRALYSLMLFAILGIYFVGEVIDQPDRIDATSLQDIAMPASLIVAWTQFVCLCLVSPMLTSHSIVGEKVGRTIPALAATPLTSGQIVLNKLSSRFIQMLVLVMIPVPVLLSIRVLGGVRSEFIVGSTSLAISTAALGLSLGMFFSIKGKSARRSAGRAMFSLVAVMFGPTLVRGILSIWIGPPTSMALFFGSSSGLMLFVLTSNELGGMPPMLTQQQLQWMWALNSLYMLGLAFFFATISTSLFRKIMLLEAAGGLVMSVKSKRRARRLRAKSTLSQPAPGVLPTGQRLDSHNVLSELAPLCAAVAMVQRPEGEVGASRDVGDAPVLWREVNRVAKKATLSYIRPDNFVDRMLLVLATCAPALAGFLFVGALLEVCALAGGPSAAMWLWRAMWMLGLPALVVALYVRTGHYRHQRRMVPTTYVVAWAILVAVLVGTSLYLYVVGWSPYWMMSNITPIFTIVVVVGCLVTVVSAATTSVGTIAAERESQTWDLLLATPLRARDIIFGKMIGTVVQQMGAFVLVWTVLGFGVSQGAVHPAMMAAVPACMIGPVVFLAGTGMLVATWFKRATTASVFNMLVGLSTWVGPWIILLIFSILFSWSGGESLEIVRNVLAHGNPFMYAIQGVVEGALDDSAYNLRGIQWFDFDITFHMVSGNYGVMPFTMMALACGAAHALIGVGAARLAVRRLRVTTRRP